MVHIWVSIGAVYIVGALHGSLLYMMLSMHLLSTNVCVAQVAEKAPKGSTILAMLPDTGERYLSTALFANINDGSDPEPGEETEPAAATSAA